MKQMKKIGITMFAVVCGIFSATKSNDYGQYHRNNVRGHHLDHHNNTHNRYSKKLGDKRSKTIHIVLKSYMKEMEKAGLKHSLAYKDISRAAALIKPSEHHHKGKHHHKGLLGWL